MTRVVYIDEETGWQSTAHAALSENYEIVIPEKLPCDISDIWELIRDTQVAIIDYRLNGDNIVSYTGDDVAREIHKHNKHFPIFIITSFEDNAIQECREVQSIRGKEMFTTPEYLEKLNHMIDSAVSIYDNKKASCEECIRMCQEKIAKGDPLTVVEEADRFDAELYLSELDLDSSARANLISIGTSKELEEMLELARSIVSNYNK